MPPKRRSAAATSAAESSGGANTRKREQSEDTEEEEMPRRNTRHTRNVPRHSSEPPARDYPDPGQLARENGISQEQEVEIRNAFGLFAIRHSHFEDSPEGVVKVEDVRRCLIALDLRPSQSDLPDILETVDPTQTGFVPYRPFLSVAALQMQMAEGSDNPSDLSSPQDSGEDEYEARGTAHASARATSESASKAMKSRGPKSKGKVREDSLYQAYRLFTHGSNGPITIHHLKAVAREIRAENEVNDELLKAMILEANGGSGEEGVRQGVQWENFSQIMKRAGIKG